MNEQPKTGEERELTLEALVQALGGKRVALAFIKGELRIGKRTCGYCGCGEQFLDGAEHGSCRYKLALIDHMHRHPGYGY